MIKILIRFLIILILGFIGLSAQVIDKIHLETTEFLKNDAGVPMGQITVTFSDTIRVNWKLTMILSNFTWTKIPSGFDSTSINSASYTFADTLTAPFTRTIQAGYINVSNASSYVFSFYLYDADGNLKNSKDTILTVVSVSPEFSTKRVFLAPLNDTRNYSIPDVNIPGLGFILNKRELTITYPNSIQPNSGWQWITNGDTLILHNVSFTGAALNILESASLTPTIQLEYNTTYSAATPVDVSTLSSAMVASNTFIAGDLTKSLGNVNLVFTEIPFVAGHYLVIYSDTYEFANSIDNSTYYWRSSARFLNNQGYWFALNNVSAYSINQVISQLDLTIPASASSTHLKVALTPGLSNTVSDYDWQDLATVYTDVTQFGFEDDKIPYFLTTDAFQAIKPIILAAEHSVFTTDRSITLTLPANWIWSQATGAITATYCDITNNGNSLKITPTRSLNTITINGAVAPVMGTAAGKISAQITGNSNTYSTVDMRRINVYMDDNIAVFLPGLPQSDTVSVTIRNAVSELFDNGYRLLLNIPLSAPYYFSDPESSFLQYNNNKNLFVVNSPQDFSLPLSNIPTTDYGSAAYVKLYFQNVLSTEIVQTELAGQITIFTTSPKNVSLTNYSVENDEFRPVYFVSDGPRPFHKFVIQNSTTADVLVDKTLFLIKPTNMTWATYPKVYLNNESIAHTMIIAGDTLKYMVQSLVDSIVIKGGQVDFSEEISGSLFLKIFTQSLNTIPIRSYSDDTIIGKVTSLNQVFWTNPNGEVSWTLPDITFSDKDNWLFAERGLKIRFANNVSFNSGSSLLIYSNVISGISDEQVKINNEFTSTKLIITPLDGVDMITNYQIESINPQLGSENISTLTGLTTNLALPDVTISGGGSIGMTNCYLVIGETSPVITKTDVSFSGNSTVISNLALSPQSSQRDWMPLIIKHPQSSLCNDSSAFTRKLENYLRIGNFTTNLQPVVVHRVGDRQIVIPKITLIQSAVPGLLPGNQIIIGLTSSLSNIYYSVHRPGDLSGFSHTTSTSSAITYTINESINGGDSLTIENLTLNLKPEQAVFAQQALTVTYKNTNFQRGANYSWVAAAGLDIQAVTDDGAAVDSVILSANPNFTGLPAAAISMKDNSAYHLIEPLDTLNILANNKSLKNLQYVSSTGFAVEPLYIHPGPDNMLGIVFNNSSALGTNFRLFNFIEAMQLSNEESAELVFSINDGYPIASVTVLSAAPEFHLDNSGNPYILKLRGDSVYAFNSYSVKWSILENSIPDTLRFALSSTFKGEWAPEYGSRRNSRDSYNGEPRYNELTILRNEINSNNNPMKIRIFEESSHGKVVLEWNSCQLYSEETLVFGAPEPIFKEITIIPDADMGKTFTWRTPLLKEDPFLKDRFPDLRFMTKGSRPVLKMPDYLTLSKIEAEDSTFSVVSSSDGAVMNILGDNIDMIEGTITFSVNDNIHIDASQPVLMFGSDTLPQSAVINVLRPDISIDADSKDITWEKGGLYFSGLTFGSETPTSASRYYQIESLADDKEQLQTFWQHFPVDSCVSQFEDNSDSLFRHFSNSGAAGQVLLDFRADQANYFSLAGKSGTLPYYKIEDHYNIHLPLFASAIECDSTLLKFSMIPDILQNDYSEYYHRKIMFNVNDSLKVEIIPNTNKSGYLDICTYTFSDSLLIAIGQYLGNGTSPFINTSEADTVFDWETADINMSYPLESITKFRSTINTDTILYKNLVTMAEDTNAQCLFDKRKSNQLTEYIRCFGNDTPHLGDGVYLISLYVEKNGIKTLPIIRQVLADYQMPEISEIYLQKKEVRFISGHSEGDTLINTMSIKYGEEGLPVYSQITANDLLYFKMRDNVSFLADSLCDSLVFSVGDTVTESFPLYQQFEGTNAMKFAGGNYQKTHEYRQTEFNPTRVYRLDKDLGAVNGKCEISLTSTDMAGNEQPGMLYVTVVNAVDGASIGTEVFNYPNPFRAQSETGTTFRYSIPEDIDKGALIVLDASGDLVFYQDLGQVLGLSAGTHEIWWNGRDLIRGKLATGVYFGILEVEQSGKKESMKIKIAVQN